MPAGNKPIIKANAGETAKIYLYGAIDATMSEAFVKELGWLRSTGHKEVELHINSGGGSVMDGIAMYNAMRSCGMIIRGFIDGIAASMASVLAFACTELYMNKYARLMMHKPKGGAWGNADELRAQADFVADLEKDMADVYSKRTGLTVDEVKAKFMNGVDNFYTASKALEAKLIDGEYDGEQVAIPDDSTDVDGIYMAFQVKMEHKFSTNMNEITLPITAELAKMLGVTASADAATVTASIKKLHVKALQADTYKQQLEELNDSLTANEVTAQLDEAKKNKVITQQQYDVFAKQYAGEPEGLKEVLATMAPFASITSKLNQQPRKEGGEYTDEVKAYMAKGYPALMQSGEMEKLNKLSPEAVKEVREAHFAEKRNRK